MEIFLLHALSWGLQGLGDVLKGFRDTSALWGRASPLWYGSSERSGSGDDGDYRRRPYLCRHAPEPFCFTAQEASGVMSDTETPLLLRSGGSGLCSFTSSFEPRDMPQGQR